MNIVDDAHCRASSTQVQKIVFATCVADVLETIRFCKSRGLPLSIMGGRHSLGRQPFVSGGVLLDLENFGAVTCVEDGIATVQGGCRWPTLNHYLATQHTNAKQWEIHQKQTGADEMSIAGAVSANAHGNAIGSGPIASDVKWLKIVTADAEEVRCDREENSELFSLVIGGFGLFGVITEIGLRLVPRQCLKRRSRWSEASEFAELAECRDRTWMYADMQLDIDAGGHEFLQSGMMNCWEASQEHEREHPTRQRETDWQGLVTLAHFDKRAAVEQFKSNATRLDGQVEYRDDFMWNTYQPNYHREVERTLSLPSGGEMLSEFFVPASELPELLLHTKTRAVQHGIDIILATLRHIRKCDVSFLRWARDDYLCLVVAMHFDKPGEDLARIDDFCSDVASFCAARGGSFYLPYRLFATKDAFHSAYPNFESFKRLKSEHDPSCIFQSDWFSEACRRY